MKTTFVQEFNMKQGLRQGCMSSLLPSNIFPTVLLIAPQHFSKDTNILADPPFISRNSREL